VKYLSVLLLLALIGCTFSRQMEVRAVAVNIATVYGDGNGDVKYRSNTTVGFLNGRK